MAGRRSLHRGSARPQSRPGIVGLGFAERLHVLPADAHAIAENEVRLVIESAASQLQGRWSRSMQKTRARSARAQTRVSVPTSKALLAKRHFTYAVAHVKTYKTSLGTATAGTAPATGSGTAGSIVATANDLIEFFDGEHSRFPGHGFDFAVLFVFFHWMFPIVMTDESQSVDILAEPNRKVTRNRSPSCRKCAQTVRCADPSFAVGRMHESRAPRVLSLCKYGSVLTGLNLALRKLSSQENHG